MEGQLVVLQIEAICGSGGIPTFVCEQQFSLFHTFPFLFECLSKANPNIYVRAAIFFISHFSFSFECLSKTNPNICTTDIFLYFTHSHFFPSLSKLRLIIQDQHQGLTTFTQICLQIVLGRFTTMPSY